VITAIRTSIFIVIIIAFAAVGTLTGLAGFAFSLFVRLVLLAFLRLVLENEGRELGTEIDVGDVTTGFAGKSDDAVFNVNFGFRVATFLTKNELGDETIEIVLELGGFVGAVDDPAVVGGVGVGLSAELETKVFNDVWIWRIRVWTKICFSLS